MKEWKLETKNFLSWFALFVATVILVATVIPFEEVIAQWSGKAALSFAAGTGTQTDPYQIADEEQFAMFLGNIESGATYEGVYFKLTSYLDMTGKTWNSSTGEFNGSLDGQFFQVKGDCRLLNKIGTAGKLLNFDYCVVNPITSSMICNTNAGTMMNIHVDGTVSGYISAICYSNSGVIANSWFSGSISYSTNKVYANSEVSLVYNNSGTIANCFSTMAMSAISSYGNAYCYPFAGIYVSGTVENCYYLSSVLSAAGDKSGIRSLNAIAKTEAELKGEEFCALLNAQVTANTASGWAAWHSSSDNYPSLAYEVAGGSISSGSITWSLKSNGLLLISGTGQIPDYSNTSSARAPWYSYASSITSVKVEEGITKVGNYAFYGLTQASQVKLADSVTSLGQYAFSSGMSYLIMPVSAGTGNSSTFSSCTALKKIVLTEGSNSGAAYNWDVNYAYSPWYKTLGQNLESLIISDGITSVGTFMFYKCGFTGTIVLPSTLTSIGNQAFRESHFSKVIFSGNMPSFGSLSFYSLSCSAQYPSLSKYGWDIASLSVNETYGTTGLTWEGYIPELSSGYYGSNVRYTLYEDGRLIFSGTGAMKNRTATAASPWAEYAGLVTSVEVQTGVTSVGDYALSDCTALTGLTLADTVETIGAFAFRNCSGLTAVSVPNSVLTINDGAFSGCGSLKNITIPFVGMSRSATGSQGLFGYIFGSGNSTDTSQYYSSSSGTFFKVPSGIEQITVNDTEQLAFGAFNNVPCNEIVLSDTVKQIGAWCFKGCSASSISVGNNVESVGAEAFSGASKLESFVWPAGLSTVSSSAFLSCTKLSSITLSSDVRTIESYAFAYCSSLSEITIPSGVGTVDAYAFCDSGLTGIVLPDSISALGSGVFSDCDSLKTAVLSESLSAVPEYCFAGCSALEAISFPAAAASIGTYAFSGCSAMTAVTVPQTVSTIETYAFNGCDSLAEMTLPFVGCSAASTGLRGIFGVIFGYGSSLTGSTRMYYADNSSTYCYIPSSLKKVTVTGGTVLSYGAFYGCSFKVSIPDTLQNIGSMAFAGYTGMTSLTLPAAVSSVGAYAFGGTVSKVTFRGNAPAFKSNSFGNHTILAEFDVLDTTWNADTCKNYGGTVTWSSAYFGTVDPAYSGSCGDSVYWTFDSSGNRMIIYGHGEMADYSTSSVPSWYYLSISSDKTRVNSILIGEGITRVGSCAFDNTSYYVSSVYLPTTLVSIGQYAFCNMANTQGISPVELTFRSMTGLVIEGSAFSSAQIISIDFGEEEVAIGPSAFRYNNALTSLVIPENVKISADSASDGAAAFYFCSNLEQVRIENDYVGSQMFASCTSLETVTVTNPDTVFYTKTGSSDLSSFEDCFLIEIIAPQCSTARAAARYYNTDFTQIDGDTTTHSLVDDLAVPPDCTHSGLTAGKHCENCGFISVAQETVNATGHRYEITTIRPTVTTSGKAIFDCLDCDHTEERAYTDSPCVHDMAVTGFESDHPYSGNSDLTWTIAPEGAELIGITFSADTALEDDFDFLYVNGKGYTGTELAGKTLYFETDTVEIRLESDSSTNDYGFALSAVIYEKHDYETEVTDPTCLEQGYTSYTCKDCTAKKVGDYTEALGHDWDDGTVTPPDCTHGGYTTYHCKRTDCEAEKTGNETDPTGHTSGETSVIETHAADCEHDGYYIEATFCKDCPAEISRRTVDIPKLGHLWDEGTVQTEPSGTTPGEMLYHCTRKDCTGTKVEPIPAPLLGKGEWGELSWTLDAAGLLTITGSGEMADFSEESEEAWRTYADQITGVTMDSTITTIGDYAFKGSALNGELKIANKTRIGAGAFEDCTGLTEVAVSKTIEAIGENAFKGCTGITSFKVAATSYTVGVGAFEPSFCTHVHTTAITGTPADCEHGGLSDGVQCDICDTVTVPQEELDPLGHTMTHVEAVEAKEDTEGNIEYYYCSVCKKYFSDEEGRNEICQTDTVIPRKGTEGNPHTFEDLTTLLNFVIGQAEESTTASAQSICAVIEEAQSIGETAETEVIEEAFGKLTTARGQLIPYTVIVEIQSDPAGLTLHGGGKYAAGDTVTLSGEFFGYKLLGWFIGEEKLTGNEFTIAETDSGTITVCAKTEAKDGSVVSVETKINAIGTVEYTSACLKLITAAREAYDELPSDLSQDVENLSVLVNAEAEFDTLESGQTKYSVALYSRVTGGDSPIALLTGGGEYYTVRGGTISADTSMEGFEFIGWYVGLTSDPEGEKYTEDTTVTSSLTEVHPTENMVLTALYRPKNIEYSVSVSADQYRITGQDTAQSDEQAFSFAPGTKVTIAYENESRELLYWTDSEGHILSRETSFTFVVTGNASVTAVSLPKGADGIYADVYFTDIDGKVICGKFYLITDTVIFPASAPEVEGKVFERWDMTQTAIRSAMAKSKYILVKPVYREMTLTQESS